MSECYLCGAYISRGQGYRRTVETGTSTRVYVTRRGGASFGFHSGTRTVCAQCARILDRTRQGAFVRGILYFLAWLVCAYLGWQVLINGTGVANTVIGLCLLVGLPVILIGAVVDALRRKAIAEAVFAETRAPADVEIDVDARRPGESVAQWFDRFTRGMPEGSERQIWKTYARYHPPKVGQSIMDWMASWPEWRDEWDAVSAGDAEVFRSDDTILSWAERVASSLSQKAGRNFEKTKADLVGMARITKPQVGEELRHYVNRTQGRLAAIDHTLDPASSASAIRDGESHAEWIGRVGPLCLEVEDGESLDDVFPKLVRITDLHPPTGDESALAWLQRVAPQIAVMNAQR